MKQEDIILFFNLVKKCCKLVRFETDWYKKKEIVEMIGHFNKGVDSVEIVLCKWLADMLKGQTYMFTEGGEIDVSQENEEAS